MVNSLEAAPYTLRGISLGGMFTSIYVPELRALFDCGFVSRAAAPAKHLFLSHGHVDHSGAIPALLGMRALCGASSPLKVYLPAAIEADVREALAVWEKMQRYPLACQFFGLRDGDEVPIGSNRFVRAFKTFHPVPSLGYSIIEHVQKLKPEFHGLDGNEIRSRKQAGEDLFDKTSRTSLAYATDTLVSVLDHAPHILKAQNLILECTFLDERKTLAAARAGCHIHLDELIPRAADFKNERLVLMHFSQLYSPQMVRDILAQRLPPALKDKTVPLLPATDQWE